MPVDSTVMMPEKVRCWLTVRACGGVVVTEEGFGWVSGLALGWIGSRDLTVAVGVM